MATNIAEKFPANPLFDEIASSRDGRDITRGYINPLERLEPTDSVLRARGGGNLQIYEEVLRDEQVKMALDQRMLAVTNCDWEVKPGGESALDQQAADALSENLKSIEWDRITTQMLFGVFYGYSVAECMWGQDGSQVILDDIKVRDRKRFHFDGLMRLRMMTSDNYSPGEDIEALYPSKFWRFCTGASHSDEPYGLGLAHWLYWPVLFKRNDVKFWLQFLDKFGSPTVVGEFPSQTTTKNDQDRLLDAAIAASSESAIIFPEGMKMYLLEAARHATADYAVLFDKMNDAIAKAVLGQTQTSEAKGGQYKSEIQMEVRQDLVKADADLVCMSFTKQVAKWLTAWNFPGALPPQVWRIVDEGEDLNDAADRDVKLHTVGFKPTMARIEEVYGEGYEANPEPVLDPNVSRGGNPNARTSVKTPADMAEPARRFPDQDAVDRTIESIEDAREQAQISQALAPIIALIESGQSYEEVLGHLTETWPEMDTSDLEEALSRAWFSFETFGRLTAKKP